MLKGKAQFISEKYQIMVNIMADHSETTANDTIEACIAGAFHGLAAGRPDSLTSMVMYYHNNEVLVVRLIALFCEHFGPKVMVGVEADGLQRPTLIGNGVEMEMLPLTSDQAGHLIVELGSVGYDIEGKMGNYYIYAKGEDK